MRERESGAGESSALVPGWISQNGFQVVGGNPAKGETKMEIKITLESDVLEILEREAKHRGRTVAQEVEALVRDVVLSIGKAPFEAVARG